MVELLEVEYYATSAGSVMILSLMRDKLIQAARSLSAPDS